MVRTSTICNEIINENFMNSAKIAVVIPCYKVSNFIFDVLEKIPECVSLILVIDDLCPQSTGEKVLQNCKDQRIQVIFNKENLGVGGAVITGYEKIINNSDIHIVVKLDGDGQMDPSLIPKFVSLLESGAADYVKGNRFYNLENLSKMPKIRLVGNAVLSFINKISSGYWNIFDPTNGYTAIHRTALSQLPLKKISKRYFFESDMLFRLNIIKAVVVDLPMDAKYSDESSNLVIRKIVFEFLIKNITNFAKRIFYNYYLRDMSVASFELPLGLILLFFGITYGVINWVFAIQSGTLTPTGTIALSGICVLLGIQFLLAFLNFDISNVPKLPRQFFQKIDIQ